ncbi:MAG: dephospho-CoA kinase [Thermodesulfovibrionia bacterium]|nr:dephospho-CoA kinase [Thermodesulfovibrionia bacterium]
MPTIGLTGGFGTGKSTVLKLFKKLGAHTVDSDKLVADILKRPVIINKLVKILGKEITQKRNGKLILIKSRIAKIIFADPEKRKAVENIIHPEVLKEIKAIRKTIYSKDKSATIVIEVPLLFETGFDKYFDKTVVVYCNREIAINRLMNKGFSREEILKRIRAQMPISRKKKLADYSINNNS